MKKLIIIILAISFIVLYSCEKSTDRDDREPPIISDIRTNISGIEETSDIIETTSGSIRINLNPDREIDTLVIGRNIYISLRVSDNDELSSLRVSIEPIDPKAPSSSTEKAFTAMPKTYSGVFGKKDTTFTKVYFGNVPPFYKGSNEEDILTIIEGDYHLKVRAVDYSGNQTDSLAYRIVRLLDPKTISGER